MQVGDIMEIDVTSLKYNKESVVKVDEVVSIPKEDLENTDIIELKDVRVKGEIYRYGCRLQAVAHSSGPPGLRSPAGIQLAGQKFNGPVHS